MVGVMQNWQDKHGNGQEIMNGIILTAVHIFIHIWLCHIQPRFQRVMICWHDNCNVSNYCCNPHLWSSLAAGPAAFANELCITFWAVLECQLERVRSDAIKTAAVECANSKRSRRAQGRKKLSGPGEDTPGRRGKQLQGGRKLHLLSSSLPPKKT